MVNPQEQKLIEYGKQSGKSEAEILTAISKFRRDAKRGGAAATPDNRSFADRAKGLVKAIPEKVTEFIGARGIADQYGASIARARHNIAGNAEAADLVENPSFKEVAGSAIETGAAFIPGAGVGATVGRKAAVGAATGYAVDAGSDIQTGESLVEAATPGIGTFTGASLPWLGKIVGETPKAMEKLNLRMTPTEQQNLAKRGKDISAYLAKKKIVGSPSQRLSAVGKLYDNMEDRIQRRLNKTGTAIPKTEISDRIKAATKEYSDDPLALPEVEKAISDFEAFLDRKNTFAISVADINKFKRSIMERAFSKNKADVVNEGKYAVATELRKILDEDVPGLRKMNEEYSDIISARRVLSKAATRNQTGILTRTLASGVGAAGGGTLGGFFGAAVGGVGAERLTNTLATPVRSATGAAAQTLGDVLSKVPVDEAGNIPVKLLIQILSGEE